VMASAVPKSMSVFKAFIRPPLGSSVPAAIRPVRPTLVMMLPVVVRCIVGTIPHTMKKQMLPVLDTTLQEHTKDVLKPTGWPRARSTQDTGTSFHKVPAIEGCARYVGLPESSVPLHGQAVLQPGRLIPLEIRRSR
jgi:hypothetical protein